MKLTNNDYSIKLDNTKVQKPKLIPKPKKRIYTFIDLKGSPSKDISYNDRFELGRWDRTKEDWKNLLGGINKTFGTAASLASFLYGGGWSAARLLNGNKASNIGLSLSRYVLPSNKIDLGFDVMQLIEDPSIANGVEVGVSKGLDKWKDMGNIYRLMSELGSLGININNVINE